MRSAGRDKQAGVPRAGSVGEETFALHLRAYSIPFERERELIPGRKWRADFWIPCALRNAIAVEIEGGTSFGKSRHSRGDGFQNDARKYNSAALAGICLLRFTTEMVKSGEAIDTVKAALGL